MQTEVHGRWLWIFNWPCSWIYCPQKGTFFQYSFKYSTMSHSWSGFHTGVYSGPLPILVKCSPTHLLSCARSHELYPYLYLVPLCCAGIPSAKHVFILIFTLLIFGGVIKPERNLFKTIFVVYIIHEDTSYIHSPRLVVATELDQSNFLSFTWFHHVWFPLMLIIDVWSFENHAQRNWCGLFIDVKNFQCHTSSFIAMHIGGSHRAVTYE